DANPSMSEIGRVDTLPPIRRVRARFSPASIRNIAKVTMNEGRRVLMKMTPLMNPMPREKASATATPTHTLVTKNQVNMEAVIPLEITATPVDRSNSPPIISNETPTAMIPMVEAPYSTVEMELGWRITGAMSAKKANIAIAAMTAPNSGRIIRPWKRPVDFLRSSVAVGAAGAVVVMCRLLSHRGGGSPHALLGVLGDLCGLVLRDDRGARQHQLAPSDLESAVGGEPDRVHGLVALQVGLLVDDEGEVAVGEALGDLGVHVEGSDRDVGTSGLLRLQRGGRDRRAEGHHHVLLAAGLQLRGQVRFHRRHIGAVDVEDLGVGESVGDTFAAGFETDVALLLDDTDRAREALLRKFLTGGLPGGALRLPEVDDGADVLPQRCAGC